MLRQCLTLFCGLKIPRGHRVHCRGRSVLTQELADPNILFVLNSIVNPVVHLNNFLTKISVAFSHSFVLPCHGRLRRVLWVTHSRLPCQNKTKLLLFYYTRGQLPISISRSQEVANVSYPPAFRAALSLVGDVSKRHRAVACRTHSKVQGRLSEPSM